MTKSRLSLGILLVVLACFFYPVEITVAPEWIVTVVDEDGKPLQGVEVSENWQQYSIESVSHEEELQTGQDGIVVFPRRTMRASLFLRLMGAIRNFLQTGVHASFGSHAHLSLFKKSYGEVGEKAITNIGESSWSGTFSSSRTKRSTLSLQKCPEGKSGFECMISDEELVPGGR